MGFLFVRWVSRSIVQLSSSVGHPYVHLRRGVDITVAHHRKKPLRTIDCNQGPPVHTFRAFGNGRSLSDNKLQPLVSSLRYMPQEILNSASRCDLAKVDVFSLGATLYELARAAPLPASGTQYQAIRQGRLTLLPQLSTHFQALIKVRVSCVFDDAAKYFEHGIGRNQEICNT